MADAVSGSPEQVALLASQLRRLRALEDEANTDGLALVYREMLAEADEAIRRGNSGGYERKAATA